MIIDQVLHFTKLHRHQKKNCTGNTINTSVNRINAKKNLKIRIPLSNEIKKKVANGETDLE